MTDSRKRPFDGVDLDLSEVETPTERWDREAEERELGVGIPWSEGWDE